MSRKLYSNHSEKVPLMKSPLNAVPTQKSPYSIGDTCVNRYALLISI